MMNDERQPGAVHRPRSRIGAAVGLSSPAARAAAAVALERQRGQRLDRLLAVTRDSAGQRRQRTRPRMRSLRLTRPGRLTWQDCPVPPLSSPSGALVRPVAMATCDLDRPLGLGATPFPRPLHFGHECVAEVLTVGEDVRSVRPGDLVAVPFQISCGACAACRAGLPGNCRGVPPISMYGFGVAGGAWGGTFAEQVAVPYADAMLVPLPPGVDPVAVASVGDTLSDAYRHIAPHLEHLRRHPDGPGILLLGSMRSQSLFGASVPLYAAQVARALIPEATLVLIDARAQVRDSAARLGFDVATPRSLRHRQAPLVVDCSADRRGMAAALAATAPDGICRCAGTLHASVPIPATRMFGRNSTLVIARSHVRTLMPAVLDLVAAGRLHPEKVTTTVAPFDDAPDALAEYLRSQVTKTVLVAADR
jgi:alcohol dehydrogenase